MKLNEIIEKNRTAKIEAREAKLKRGRENAELLSKLRAAGLKVRIEKLRYAISPVKVVSPEGRRQALAISDIPLSKGEIFDLQAFGSVNFYNNGGVTTVITRNAQGNVYYFEAKCSPADRFDRAMGVNIALKRAVEALF
jgi:hypothetical protein